MSKNQGLLVVLDTHPSHWRDMAVSGGARALALFDFSTQDLTFDEALQHVLLLINAHLASHLDNRVAVIAAHAGHRSGLLAPKFKA